VLVELTEASRSVTPEAKEAIDWNPLERPPPPYRTPAGPSDETRPGASVPIAAIVAAALALLMVDALGLLRPSSATSWLARIALRVEAPVTHVLGRIDRAARHAHGSPRRASPLPEIRIESALGRALPLLEHPAKPRRPGREPAGSNLTIP
jgi:hypothetical protein